MRIGIIVDSTCDLPHSFIEQHGIVLLPISISLDGETFVDTRDPAATAAYYQGDMGKRGHAAETASYSVEQISDLFLSRLVLDYDCVFCLTVTASRSPIHANASKASFAILKQYRPIRERADIHSPFLMRVIDTQNLFAAQGVTAVEAARMVAAGASPGRIRERLEVLAGHTWGYCVPRDLYYLRARAKKKGDHSVGMFSAVLGSALDIKPILQCHRGETQAVGKLRGYDAATQALFDYTAERVRAGLLTRTLCVSFGGDLAELETLPGYAQLAQACAQHDTTLYASTMSITGMVNLGIGTVSLGFAAEDHEVKF
ncbi:MAG: DegV family protein [Xanthomonadales bacterium]|nr:DegV family protein [Xanthomonadales bacterium]